jgi:D-sedoheptulose 7-phosphate isomerase
MNFYEAYVDNLHQQLRALDYDKIEAFVSELLHGWVKGRKVFICGNGGSAANAEHIANDLLYGVNPKGLALNIEALSSNSAVLTCLANDTGYENIYAQQLISKAQAGDMLIVLSGSGNSPNIVKALQQARLLKMKTCAVVGFTGGKAKELADIVIHSPIEDMQISEDIQLVLGHWMMRRLNSMIKIQQDKKNII